MTWTSASFKGLSETAANKIVAGTSTKQGGVSQAPFFSLNVATHVGDNVNDVLTNRKILNDFLGLPIEPFWLNQTHTTNIVKLPKQAKQIKTLSHDFIQHSETAECDASFTLQNEQVCCVMTADCLPILVVDINATIVCAIHAGWRGLVNGIVENSIQRICQEASISPDQLSVWIGPAISKANFEVGQEVKDLFEQTYPSSGHYFESKSEKQKYLADLPGLAEFILHKQGVALITQSKLCSYALADEYFSFRRSGQTGRMASLIWLK